jgi:hypothetical protein
VKSLRRGGEVASAGAAGGPARSGGVVLPFSLELDRAAQPSRAQLADAVALVVKERL